jgi:putative two-component system response regulator
VSETHQLLVVEDEEVIRRAVCRLLASRGFSVLSAPDVHHAIEILKQESVSLVLSDIQMPGPSGLDLVDWIRESGRMPQTAVVMVTGVDDNTTAIQALKKGAYAYVFKPFSRSELFIQIDAALRRRELELASQRTEQELQAEIRAKTAEIRHAHEEIVMRLMAASEFRDNETGKHIRRLGLYAAELARLLGWSEEEQDRIRLAAAMHDVGKIGIPDHILLKPGGLGAEEWRTMKEHTRIGHQILTGSAIPVLEMASRIALSHHERWNGSGYPDGSAGADIAIEARIIALVDVYDALTHARCYKPAWPEEDAVAEMKRLSGVQFDPELLALFLDNLPAMRRIRLENADV